MITRITIILVFVYTVIMGGSFRGILLAEFRWFSLFLLLMLFAGWLLLRWRKHWRWHHTPLDRALPLWLLAFGLSLVFNLDSARTILLALWYMGLYIALWYMFHDAVANKALPPRTLVDAVLLSGVAVVVIGYIELFQVAIPAGMSLFEYRPNSVLGNPNTLGPFLIALIFFILGQIIAVRSWVARGALTLYLLPTGFLFFLTFSRSAWLAFGGAVCIGIWLLATKHGLSRQSLRQWWHQTSTGLRVIVLGLGGGIIIVAGAMSIKFTQTFLDGGRIDNGRLWLYEAALNIFTENPLAGQGLFTFPQNMGKYISLPPLPAHIHAHSLLFNVLAELGIVGLIALGFSIYLLIRWLWRDSTARSIHAMVGGITAAGIGLAHLFDVPAFLPLIALVTLIALILLSQPHTAAALQSGKRTLGLSGLWVILLLTGFWDASLYSQYLDTLRSGLDAERYAETAEALQPFTDADPLLYVYPAQQAFLWGTAANNGDEAARQRAIDAYRRTLELHPHYAPYYANLAALYWDNGQIEQGIEYMSEAAALTPDSWVLYYNVGLYAEELGDDDMAREAYEQALAADADADLHPAWAESSIRAELQGVVEDRTPEAQVVTFMETGEIERAIEVWEQELDPRDSINRVLRSLLALAQNERQEAQRWYDLAGQRRPDPLWLQLNEVYLARYDGDDETADSVLAALREQLTLTDSPQVEDYVYGLNPVQLGQFRFMTSRQFLPQVFFPAQPPVLLHLVEAAE